MDAVRIQYVRRLLHRFAWFGLDKNALLRLESSRGHMDVLVRTFASKPGPPNALVRLEPTLAAQFGGRATRASDIPKFIEALTRFYLGKDVSLSETYKLMAKHLYVQKSRDAEGQEVVYPIAPSKIPSFFAFEKRAPKLIRLLRMKAQKEGRKDGKAYEEPRGRDSDLARRAGDVYDVDATPFNKESVADHQPNGQMLNAGKQTVLVLRDRATGKGMGWHCYTGYENWDEGYRLLLFCALTSKKRHLEWLEVDKPDAWPDNENIRCLAWD